MNTLLLVLHVLAAVFLIGPMAVLPMSALRALRARSAAQIASLAQSTYVTSLLSLVVVVLGFGVLGTSDASDHFSMSTSWIWSSLLMYVVALALNLGIVVPALRKAATQVGTGGESAPMPDGYRNIAISNGLVSLLLMAVVVLMVWQP